MISACLAKGMLIETHCRLYTQQPAQFFLWMKVWLKQSHNRLSASVSLQGLEWAFGISQWFQDPELVHYNSQSLWAPHLCKVRVSGAVGASQEDAWPHAVDMKAQLLSHLHRYCFFLHGDSLPALLTGHWYMEHNPPLTSNLFSSLEIQQVWFRQPKSVVKKTSINANANWYFSISHKPLMWDLSTLYPSDHQEEWVSPQTPRTWFWDMQWGAHFQCPPWKMTF